MAHRMIIILMALLPTVPESAKGQVSASVPEFEVADLRQCTTRQIGTNTEIRPNGYFALRHTTPRRLLATAYSVTEDRIEGSPDWTASLCLDLIAKVPSGSTVGSTKRMLQSLLVKEFKISFHEAKEKIAVYELQVLKSSRLPQPAQATAASGICVANLEAGLVNAKCRGVTMDGFARQLRGLAPGYLEMSVVDRTELAGMYDFDVTWAPKQSRRQDGPVVMEVVTIFDAIERQLGLKLAPGEQPMSTIVIDHIERPVLQ